MARRFAGLPLLSLAEADLRIMFHGARILVAPLDWGLGHAARCVPIVRALLEQDAVPIIGADKGPLALLREEFPKLELVRLPGMEVRYATGTSQAWAMARQLPRMLRQVREERRLFATVRKQFNLQAVISDQRFGIRDDDLPSVLITHQIFPFSPFAQGQARRINLRHIRRFHRCWIPDHTEAPGLAGELSHGPSLPGNARYIGPLSRFMDSKPAPGRPVWHTVSVISGPEPQRAQFEEAVTGQLDRIDDGPHLIIPGRIDAATQRLLQLPTDQLHADLLGTDLIISRTGYSTLMDLEVLGRGALLVPTPGQPEQEYLGRLHAAQGLHIVQQQDGLDIASVLKNPPASSQPAPKSDALFSAMADLAQLIHPSHHSSSGSP